jgi:hypothetical protein
MSRRGKRPAGWSRRSGRWTEPVRPDRRSTRRSRRSGAGVASWRGLSETGCERVSGNPRRTGHARLPSPANRLPRAGARVTRSWDKGDWRAPASSPLLRSWSAPRRREARCEDWINTVPEIQRIKTGRWNKDDGSRSVSAPPSRLGGGGWPLRRAGSVVAVFLSTEPARWEGD